MTHSIKKILLGLLLTTSMYANAADEDSPFGIGISGGAITGTGVDVVKYFGDYYVHGSAMVIYQAESDSFKDFALVAGKFLHKEEILSFGLPVGFKIFAGLNYNNDDELRKGFGFGVELFNPGRKGISLWYDVAYGTPGYVDRFTFYNATGLMYNF